MIATSYNRRNFRHSTSGRRFKNDLLEGDLQSYSQGGDRAKGDAVSCLNLLWFILFVEDQLIPKLGLNESFV